MKKITANDVVLALKAIKLSTSAKSLAFWMNTSSRAIATALRGPVDDGRIYCRYQKGIAYYRFVRLAKNVVVDK